MIKVTRINNSVLYVNPDLIEFLEATPDVVISLTTGKKLMVTESIEELIGKIIEYKKEIFSNFPNQILKQ